MTGNIRNIPPNKQFAFIQSGKERDIFVHKDQFYGNWADLVERFKRGPVMVEFELDEGPKGLRAIKCSITEHE